MCARALSKRRPHHCACRAGAGARSEEAARDRNRHSFSACRGQCPLRLSPSIAANVKWKKVAQWKLRASASSSQERSHACRAASNPASIPAFLRTPFPTAVPNAVAQTVGHCTARTAFPFMLSPPQCSSPIRANTRACYTTQCRGARDEVQPDGVGTAHASTRTRRCLQACRYPNFSNLLNPGCLLQTQNFSVQTLVTNPPQVHHVHCHQAPMSHRDVPSRCRAARLLVTSSNVRVLLIARKRQARLLQSMPEVLSHSEARGGPLTRTCVRSLSVAQPNQRRYSM